MFNTTFLPPSSKQPTRTRATNYSLVLPFKFLEHRSVQITQFPNDPTKKC